MPDTTFSPKDRVRLRPPGDLGKASATIRKLAADAREGVVVQGPIKTPLGPSIRVKFDTKKIAEQPHVAWLPAKWLVHVTTQQSLEV